MVAILNILTFYAHVDKLFCPSSNLGNHYIRQGMLSKLYIFHCRNSKLEKK